MIPDHTITMTLAPSDDQAARVYELIVRLHPLGWRCVWEFWSPGSVSRLRCEGPTGEAAVEMVRAWAERMPVLMEPPCGRWTARGSAS